MVAVDFKAPLRVKDKGVYTLFHAAGHRCIYCNRPHPNAAHLLRGNDREDVLAALIPLCGSGAHGCHGAFDSGHSYTASDGTKVTPSLVKAAVALWLRFSAEAQPQRDYLSRKLGPFGAEAYVQRFES